MTNTIPTPVAQAPARGSLPPARIARSIGYDAALVPVSLLAAANSLLGRTDAVHRAWSRAFRIQRAAVPVMIRRPGAVRSFGYSVLSLVLGLLGWFLLMMLGAAVLRGAFYGFVTHGPYGPGTWGGPTKAGAWAMHAAVAVPVLFLLPLLLRGLGLLHAAFIRCLYGVSAGWWVLPTTIAVAVAGALLFYSWTQQL
jgi:hypothetical protein